MNDDLYKKISLSFNHTFVGNTVLSDDDLKEIYEKTGLLLRNVNYSNNYISYKDYELVFVAIINITKNWSAEQDYAFFSYIYKSLLGISDVKPIVYKQIIDIVKYLEKSKRIFTIKTGKRYYSTILCHALSPVSSIESFFNMCWVIYSHDFDYSFYQENTIYQTLASQLIDKFNKSGNNDESFNIGSDVYSIKIGIKGFALTNKNLFSDFIKETIKDIDNLFNNSPLKNVTYFECLIKRWWSKKESEFGSKRSLKKYNKYEKIVDDYSKIKVRYSIEDSHLVLDIPAFILLDNFDISPVCLLKLNKVNYKKPIEINSDGILIKTNKLKIDLSDYYSHDFLENISVQIIHGENTIYDSKDTLKRNFLLFNLNGREIFNNKCSPGNYFLFCFNFKKIIYGYPKETHYEGAYYYSIEANSGEKLSSQNKTVFFDENSSSHSITINGQFSQDVIYIKNNEEYNLLNGDIYIDLSSEVNENDIFISFNKTKFKLKEFPYKEVNGNRRYYISGIMDYGECAKINVFSYSSNSCVCTSNYIKFKNIQIQYDKPIYYGEESLGKIEFKTENYHLISDFDINDGDIYINFCDGELKFTPPVLKWKIDDGEFNLLSNKRLFYKDFSNNSVLELSLPIEIKGEVLLKNNFSKNIVIEKNNTNFKYEMGRTVHAFKFNNEKINNISIIFQLENMKELLLMNIYLNDSFIYCPFSVDSDNKKIVYDLSSYVGEKSHELFLNIYKKGSNKTVSQPIKLSKQKNTLNASKLADGYYDLKIEINEGSSFITTKKEIIKQTIELGSKKKIRFLNKILCLDRVMLFDSYYPIRINLLILKNIQYLKTIEGFDLYSAELFINHKGNLTSVNYKKNKETLEKVKINPVRLEILSGSTLYLGYGLDSEDDYDDEFSLNINDRWISISKPNKFIKTIDYYYYYEEKEF